MSGWNPYPIQRIHGKAPLILRRLLKHNLIPFGDLNLTDRFLFDEVMEDPQTHQDALSIIFGHPVPLRHGKCSNRAHVQTNRRG